MNSKRCALRFRCEQQPLSYKTSYEEGDAQLLNLSTSGCAFVELTLPLSIGEKVLVSIELASANAVFQAQGLVVRVESGGCTAVHFTLIELDDILFVRKFFARSLRNKGLRDSAMGDVS